MKESDCMNVFELQPLRIPAGWTVKYNAFSEYDPEKDGVEFSYELQEDLLQLTNKNLLIDLGWYPNSNVDGSYKLFLVDMNVDRPFDMPLESFCSKSKREVIYNTNFCLKYRLRLYFRADFQSAAKIFDFGKISIELCFRRLSPHTALRCL